MCAHTVLTVVGAHIHSKLGTDFFTKKNTKKNRSNSLPMGGRGTAEGCILTRTLLRGKDSRSTAVMSCL